MWKNVYLKKLDLEKAFYEVSRNAVWGTLRIVGGDECLVKIVPSMYSVIVQRVKVSVAILTDLNFLSYQTVE